MKNILLFSILIIYAISAVGMEPTPHEESYAQSMTAHELHWNLQEELARAIENQDITQVKALLAQGASASDQCNRFINVSPLSLAVATKNLEICRLLIADGAHHAAYHMSALWSAIRCGDIDIFNLLLDATSSDALSKNQNYTGCLPCTECDYLFANAVDANNIEAAKILLQKGANIDVKVGNGLSGTPLMKAVGNDNYAMCAFIIEAGADVNARATNGETALFEAAFFGYEKIGYEKICRLLLEAGANPNALRDYDYDSPLLQAANKGNGTICTLLLNAGANIDHQNKYGCNALLKAQNSTVRRVLAAYGTQGKMVNSFVWAARQISNIWAQKNSNPYNYRLAHLSDNSFTLENKLPTLYKLVLNDQIEINEHTKTTLLLLNRMKKSGDPCARLLYRQFKILMRPHIGEFISLKRLIEARDADGKQAYDYLGNEELKPKDPSLLEKCVVQ